MGQKTSSVTELMDDIASSPPALLATASDGTSRSNGTYTRGLKKARNRSYTPTIATRATLRREKRLAADRQESTQ
jgi:hypothetical protein